MKMILYTFFLAFALCSCQTVPPGDPPASGVLAEQIQIPSNIKTEKTAKEALDFMLTSIVSSCEPVSTASTTNPPCVVNNFIASTLGTINYMPLEIWTNLTKMKFINPVTDSDSAKYILQSEFMLPEDNTNNKLILWKMQLIEKDTNTSIWKSQVTFIP